MTSSASSMKTASTRRPSIFDTNKLTWFNAEYIRQHDPRRTTLELAKPWLAQVLDPQKFDLRPPVRSCLQARTEIFSQLPGMVDFLAEMPELDVGALRQQKEQIHSGNQQGRRSSSSGPILAGIDGLDGGQPARHGDGRHSRNPA